MTTDNTALFRTLLDLGVRAALVLALAAWCFQIIAPFVPLLLWGGVIAIALAPLYQRLRHSLGERDGAAATVFILACLALLIVPTVVLSTTLVETGTRLAEALRAGDVTVPAPPDSVAGWPLIGERLHAFWSLAASNLESATEQLAPYLKPIATWLLKQLAGGGVAILQLALSVVVAGLFLAKAPAIERAIGKLLARITDEYSVNIRRLCVATIRSVAQGVLGIAIAQGLLAGLGMVAAGVPGAGLWALLVMLVAIVQLPPLLIMGPIIVYVFAVESTTVAVVFAIWSAAVSFSDGVLKPLLLGRGTGVPMLVILLGAIGGLMTSGLIGLFLGAVLLAVGYELFRAWLDREAPAEAIDPAPDGDAGPGSHADPAP
jgi:predicted PurR-regulated permease PerM